MRREQYNSDSEAFLLIENANLNGEYLVAVENINEGNFLTFESKIVSEERTLETLKFAKKDEINKSCNLEILSGFISTAKNNEEKHYDFTYEDQINLLGLFTAVTIGGQTQVEWKNSDQLICEYWTANEFLQLYNEAMTFKTQKIKRNNELKVQIMNATTKDEVESIVW